MCASTAAADSSATPSKLDVLLERLAKESSASSFTTVSAEDVKLIADLAKRYRTLKTRDECRIAIDRAKEIVADQVGCKLSEAFHWIQKRATAKNKTLEETVELILLAEDMRREREAETNGRPARRRES